MRLIDADALAKAFRDMAESVAFIQKDRTYWSESLISAAEEVDDAPTVDAVERKRGWWVKVGQSFLNPGNFRNYSCSECGYDIEKVKLNYCPNCGADMRGGAE